VGGSPNPFQKREGTIPGRLLLAAFGISLLFGSSGCEPPPPSKPQPTASAPLPPPPPPPPPPASTPSTTTPQTAATPPASPLATQPAPAASPAPNTVAKKAEVGVGKKGRNYGKDIIATPAASLWATRERLVFEVQIPEAMKLFKATEDRAPKTHAEFMEKIIKANNIHLPELPEGQRYQYDPKTEQLMVKMPKPE
jgi:hypothetical protein